MTKLAIVILNWNGKKFLQDYLPSLVKNSQVEGVEIVVADNASKDGSVEWLKQEHPDIRTILLDKNYGFTGGYNRALEQIEAKYFLLLNSDIEVTAGWIPPLLEHMESDPKCGACTSRIRDLKQKERFEYAGAAGGFIDRHGYPFCRGRIFDSLEEDHGQYDDPQRIFWGSGACLLVRAEVWREAGGLDEDFFAHMEEIDLCWRMQHLGYHVSYVPGSTVYHLGGGTLQRGNPRKTYLNFRNNLLLLHKNLPSGKRGRILLIRMLLDGVSAIRFLLTGDVNDFRAVFRAHMSYYGMKKAYRGMDRSNILRKNDVIAEVVYPGSIVAAFFLKGKKKFSDLDWPK